MIELGRCQELVVLQLVANGAILGDENGEVLLPRKYVPSDLEVGDSLRVFVHTDSDDRLVATTRMPSATLGNVAVMEAVDRTASSSTGISRRTCSCRRSNSMTRCRSARATSSKCDSTSARID